MKNRLKKILISAILAFSVATAPLNVSAGSDMITDTNSSSRTIVVSYDVDATYTVNIPSSISLTDTAGGKTESVTCDTLIMSQGKGLAFSIRGANTSDDSANFSVKNEENEASTVAYSITADDVIDVKSNNRIKTFHGNNKKANLNFLITGEQSAEVAGEHKEHLTFEFAPEDVVAVDKFTIEAEYWGSKTRDFNDITDKQIQMICKTTPENPTNNTVAWSVAGLEGASIDQKTGLITLPDKISRQTDLNVTAVVDGMSVGDTLTITVGD